MDHLSKDRAKTLVLGAFVYIEINPVKAGPKTCFFAVVEKIGRKYMQFDTRAGNLKLDFFSYGLLWRVREAPATMEELQVGWRDR